MTITQTDKSNQQPYLQGEKHAVTIDETKRENEYNIMVLSKFCVI